MPRLALLLAVISASVATIGIVVTGAAFASEVSVERGLQVSIMGGCHDCHTEGYNEANGTIDPDKALKGSLVGWRGPWGTTYASNLRVISRQLSERGFVVFMKHVITQPPMPWYNLRAFEESDLQSLYQYIRSLGEPGEQVPLRILDPDVEPPTPYVQLTPQTPKG